MRKTTKIEVDDNTYKCIISDTQEQRSQGLKHLKNLPKNIGMLFIHNKEARHPYWMAETHIPLSLIYINSDRKIVDVKHRTDTNNFRNVRPEAKAKYVLEVNLDKSLDDHIGKQIHIGEVSHV